MRSLVGESTKAARSAVAFTACAVLTTFCGGEASLPKAPAAATITMQEYRFGVSKTLSKGRLVVTAENLGQQDHQLTLIQLAKDFPPLDQQLRGTTRRGAPTVLLMERRPQTKGIFALDLLPGRYGLVCFLTDADGVSHALKGMNAEFRVR